MDFDHTFPESPKRRNPREVKKIRLNNAKLLAFEYPETFNLPSDSAIKKIKPGDFVKVASSGERFWVMVSGFEGRKYFGNIANDLVNSDLKKGDTISFYKKNIYDIEYD